VKRFKQPKTPYLPTVVFEGYRDQDAGGEQRKEDLERFCDLLNSTGQSELRRRLRQLVKAWQDSGPNLEQMTYGSHKQLLTPLQLICVGHWMPTTTGRAVLYVQPDVHGLEELVGRHRVHEQQPNGRWELTPEANAWIEFGFFTLNPHCEELAGPCARCDRYYIKKRASQKVYCSRRCGNAATAVVRTRERIADERADKLTRAKAAMKKWKPAATRQDWKTWVAGKTGIDQRFLTRAVTKGDLVPPQKEK
jgi:hypothetical protein